MSIENMLLNLILNPLVIIKQWIFSIAWIFGKIFILLNKLFFLLIAFLFRILYVYKTLNEAQESHCNYLDPIMFSLYGAEIMHTSETNLIRSYWEPLLSDSRDRFVETIPAPLASLVIVQKSESDFHVVYSILNDYIHVSPRQQNIMLNPDKFPH